MWTPRAADAASAMRAPVPGSAEHTPYSSAVRRRFVARRAVPTQRPHGLDRTTLAADGGSCTSFVYNFTSREWESHVPRSGPRTLYKYADECKQTAARLSPQPGMQVKTVAAALEIDPFMLSKWREDVRDGIIRGRAVKAPPPAPTREIAQRQALEQRYAELQQEHALLKKPFGSVPLNGRNVRPY